MNWISILLSALFSGLLGVAISNWYHNRNEIWRIKYHVFLNLLGNRHDLKGQLFTEALNQIIVAFNGCPEVLNALKAFHDTLSAMHRDPNIENQKLLDLFKAICKHLKVKIDPLTDNYFFKVFNIKT